MRGQLHNESPHNGPLIAVGRNPASCQGVLDQKQLPTVSRQHAQFQFHEGRWLVTDSGSTYGTFVDGHQIHQPTEVRVNSRVQFGLNGPVLKVTKIETTDSQSLGS